MILSLIVPIYRNESCIPDLLLTLTEFDRAMEGDFEAVLVVDGSPDRCYEILRQELPSASFCSQLVLLSRNFGGFPAVRAGLEAGRGEIFAVMTADGQEPPELILQFRKRLLSGEFDVVVGSRTARSDPLFSRLSSGLFWTLYRRFVQPNLPERGVDVFAFTRQVRDHVLAMQESNSTLVGLVLWLGFRRTEVEYARRPRRHGKGAWSFRRKLRYLLDSAFAFSDLPIRLLSAIGFAGVLCSFVLGIAVAGARLSGAIAVPGYAAMVIVVMFFGGLNSLGLGLIGEYLWRTFENTKRRPNHVVAIATDFSGERPHDTTT